MMTRERTMTVTEPRTTRPLSSWIESRRESQQYERYTWRPNKYYQWFQTIWTFCVMSWSLQPSIQKSKIFFQKSTHLTDVSRVLPKIDLIIYKIYFQLTLLYSKSWFFQTRPAHSKARKWYWLWLAPLSRYCLSSSVVCCDWLSPIPVAKWRVEH